MGMSSPRLSIEPHQSAPSQVAALQRAIAECAARGWRLQSASAATAVMTYRHGGDINHVMHAILSLFTGFWLFVWLFIAVSAPKWALIIAVDEAGNVSYQQSR